MAMSKHPSHPPFLCYSPAHGAAPPRLEQSEQTLCVCLSSAMKVFHFFILTLNLASLDPENCGDFILNS